MRYTCVTIDFGEDNPSYRYADMKDPNNLKSTVDSVEDLKDGYFKWTRGKDFQWFVEPSQFNDDTNAYTIAFYENHPYFNCMLLLSSYLEDVLPVERYVPIEAVEEWIDEVLYEI
jgi:hypothetical protein